MISIEIQYHINLIILSRELFRIKFQTNIFKISNEHFQNFNKHFQNLKIPKIHMILYSFLQETIVLTFLISSLFITRL